MISGEFKTVSLHRRVHEGLSEIAAIDGRTLAGTVGGYVQERLAEIDSKIDLIGINARPNLLGTDPVVVLKADDLPTTVLDLDEAELIADVLATGAAVPKSLTSRRAGRFVRIARDGRHSIEVAIDGRSASMSREVAEIFASVIRQRVIQARILARRAAV